MQLPLQHRFGPNRYLQLLAKVDSLNGTRTEGGTDWGRRRGLAGRHDKLLFRVSCQACSEGRPTYHNLGNSGLGGHVEREVEGGVGKMERGDGEKGKVGEMGTKGREGVNGLECRRV